ncbi:MAG: hypothetical protein AAF901_14375, partial [Bacteroidota bacterium]
MPQKEQLELRSEQVQEILSEVPNKIIRYGNTTILLMIIMLLAISWFIKYPDVVASEALVTTMLTPQKGYARINGNIDTLLVEDNQTIKTGMPLAIMENTANAEDVFFLKSILDTISLNKAEFNYPFDEVPILFLGSIESDYVLFENNYIEYQLNKQLQILNNNKKTNATVARTKEEIGLFRNVIQSFNQLKKAIKAWEMNYVLSADIDGTVSFLNVWKSNQPVTQGDLIFTIIPENN